jgi:hypothetical protein
MEVLQQVNKRGELEMPFKDAFWKVNQHWGVPTSFQTQPWLWGGILPMPRRSNEPRRPNGPRRPNEPKAPE